ncbi:hypothetical protein M2277_005011 [Paenibacillus sp. LBL]|uniref:hypothetical protein n=1 Tax=Paenibacillus sp. LBL TaxID=2940563 RepID=UPI0024742C41|nr:hypothetical protein [Paenibacillus sp. LBL]MDH6674319.1 hypothetical protein [Paenibacillus sp. LBL]
MTDRDFRYVETAAKVGDLVALKQQAYGNSVDATFEVMKGFLRAYKGVDGDYIIPEALLKHILLQVRIIDKQNRIFNNPEGDLMDESPYRDMLGYSLLGIKMAENK